MKTRSMLAKLAKRFPKWIAVKNHDHVGLMEGKLPEETKKILLCLDFDEVVLPTALKERPDLVITHHPFLFGTRASVLKNDEKKKALYEEMERAGIPIISMHTNFDEGRGGMNDALTARLGLSSVYAPSAEPMMRIGELNEPMDVLSFSESAKQRLGVPYGLLIQEGPKTIRTVGIIGGGGSRDYVVARDLDVDIYVSGDVSHHVRRDMVRDHMNYLDLPHEIERIFMPTMKDILLDMDPTLDIVVVNHEECPKLV